MGFVILGFEVFDFADDTFTIKDFTEDYMFAVEVRGRDCSDEELGAIGTYEMSLSIYKTAVGQM